jgi:hypothetical protein
MNMKTVKTSELIGTALDLAVDMALGKQDQPYLPHYSTQWQSGGPIIEREKMEFLYYTYPLKGYFANPDIDQGNVMSPGMYGETMLIAAMRCYVASKLGDEVEIPEDLYVLDNENR